MTIDYKVAFTNWYENEFKATDLYNAMANTTENSRWHREESVAVHTDMVVSEYLKNTQYQWGKYDLMGAIVCAIHDIGKPGAKEVLERDDGTKYNRFTGHEQLSGMLWIDYILSTDTSIQVYISDSDIYNIAVMAQYHLPYGIKNTRVQYLKSHLEKFGLTNVFIKCLVSDCNGRIADNPQDTVDRMSTWVESVFGVGSIKAALEATQVPTGTGKFEIGNNTNTDVVLMVGCAGIGKSTYIKNHLSGMQVHSLDTIRIEKYRQDGDPTDPIKLYELVFNRANECKDFSRHAINDFNEKHRSGNIVVDNTNLTPKSRIKYRSWATKSASIGAIVFLSSFDFGYDRVKNRKDKHIPYKEVSRMYYKNYVLPIYGECDIIIPKLYFSYERS